MIRAPAALLTAVVAIGLAACAAFEGEPIATAAVPGGVQTRTVGDVAVSVAILTDEQARAHFGADFGSLSVQALWLSVANGSPYTLWSIRNIVDPDFYSADEASQLVRKRVPAAEFERLRRLLRDESIRVLMRPAAVTEGFVFLPGAEGGRYVDVCLAQVAFDRTLAHRASAAGATGPDGMASVGLRFGFAVPLPDGDFDYERLDTSRTYADAELPDLDTIALRAELERLHCCTTDATGEHDGDPLNVVLVGDAADVLVALSRSGWSFTHRVTPGSVRRLVGAAVARESYPIAAVSSLYAFGRRRDIALQRARRSIAQRNHMRLRLAPFLHEGHQV